MPVLGDWNAKLGAFAGRATRQVRTEGPNGGVDIKPITLVSTGSLADGFDAWAELSIPGG
ncbi:hypothetical protein [Mesorhizobium sp. Root102]|uniref:hypothetical protein n=1 Tax=Mesorhizobium sp. Root102 TaxID=1736422 RepID=UPI0012E3E6EC|nr:hypothetical protein [Mesorhizobium sp. Root102]